MKRAFIISIWACACSLTMYGQGVIDALPALSSQLQGTARYSAMGGAFGALGGDMTSIKQNPAGLGVYRSSEISVTAGLNFFGNNITTPTNSSKNNDFYFTGDNLGIVGVIKMKSGVLRNLNFGFAYNNIANFNNDYRADWSNIGTSLTEMVANNTTSYKLTPSDLAIDGSYNPYQTNAPWLSVLAYNTYLINPTGAFNNEYTGIYRQGMTRGNAYLHTITTGSMEEYDFNISGNILDRFYWGLTLNISNINYNLTGFYGEQLQNAEILDNEGKTSMTDGEFTMQNTLKTTGVGVGVKLGVIYRPFNALRLGLAVHSPTYYDMTDIYMAAVGYDFKNVGGKALYGSMEDPYNQTDIGSYNYHLTTPWHFIVSAAGVLGKTAIISLDYEYTDANNMYYSGDADYDESSNLCINEQMQGIHNLRAGVEFRITPSFSIRAGYGYETSPMKNEYYEGEAPQIVEGTLTQYQIPADAHNISCGIGYRINNVYIDAAYVHRMQNFSIYPYVTAGESYRPTTMDMRHNSIKITAGYRF